MTCLRLLTLTASLLLTLSAWSRPLKNITDKEVVDAYQYLMARVLVLRQQQADFAEGFKWNELVHRDVGGVQWANPNLDVAYSEAWVAIDESSCTLLDVPQIKDRYFTVQVLNGWGETTANINDRNYRNHPYGKFALCLKDSKVSLPMDTVRVNLPSRISRVLARVQIGRDAEGAAKLQREFKLTAMGQPNIANIPKVPDFPHRQIPGIEIFENASAILASEKDINPGMGGLQTKVRAVEKSANTKITRDATEKSLREKALPSFLALREKILKTNNGWGFPRRAGAYGGDYQARSFINYAGIWANVMSEAVYVSSATDIKGEPLNGSNTYTMTFPKGKLPDSVVRYFWSITAVDNKDFKAIPNPENKHNLSNVSDLKKNADGSLTLYFSAKLPKDAPEQNWLPTEAGAAFHLTLRFYGGNKDILNRRYKPPGLQKTETLAKLEEGTIY